MAAKSKRKQGAGRRAKKKNEQSFVADEIIIWSTLAVSILILLSNFGGAVGKTISGILKGIFGTVAYAVPFVLFAVVAFLVSNKDNFKAYIKGAAGLVLTVLSCTFFQLVWESGGLIGEGVSGLLIPAVGIAGSHYIRHYLRCSHYRKVRPKGR